MFDTIYQVKRNKKIIVQWTRMKISVFTDILVEFYGDIGIHREISTKTLKKNINEWKSIKTHKNIEENCKKW